MRRADKSSHKLRTGVVATVAACLVIGIVTLGSADRVSDSHGPTARELEDALAASIRITPSAASVNVHPDEPIVVTSELGRLTDVRVTSPGGPVQGTWDDAANRWKSHGLLLYGQKYRVQATVTGAANLLAQKTMSFKTLVPSNTVTASVFPTSGLEVGVGQPIVFTFSQDIPKGARAALERHIIVATKPKKVVGRWHWFNDHELHYRPQALWPAGTDVTVIWSLPGWHAGDSIWGDGRGATKFSIGKARVSIADLATFKMTVTENGRVVATYPMSGGRPSDPTMGGTHVVMDRQSVVRMNSATNGVPVDSPDGYDELVYSNVHISDSGEYVHAAPWSTGSQGSANVSHGCINLSPENAEQFMDFSRVGDVVIVAGSPRGPEFGDHGVMDWSTPWSEWTPTP
jgi:lipoprotein-anchoring transpeptidase ErfK/SrfK